MNGAATKSSSRILGIIVQTISEIDGRLAPNLHQSSDAYIDNARCQAVYKFIGIATSSMLLWCCCRALCSIDKLDMLLKYLNVLSKYVAGTTPYHCAVSHPVRFN